MTTTDSAAQGRDLVERVRQASRAADGHDPLDEQAALLLKHRGLAAARMWVTGNGFALVHEGALDLAVAPEARGRGEGATLAAAVADSGADVRTAWSHGDDPAARAIAARHGFAATRELWVMRRPVTEPLPPLESDVAIRGYRPADEADLLRVNAAAFAHHPEQGSMDAAGLAERMAEPWFDPAGLLVAHDGERMLGFHWTKQHDADLGEVYVVAIAPEAQGAGLGRMLTLAGLHHLAGHGVREVLLYVESDNHPARKVYERLGFTHAASDTHVQFTRS
ncbi:mycothiol synthase [Nocardioides guangzhouensis]|uniref:Mycothiol acetyltransferase n=1 Tax=Nocardioides guangzhouensis TaxID=2497878 RepID=A0A4Q4ZBH9_9ACTN|nr:mycothiol synthase [Nocardioides guangzhouensis]